VLPIVLEENREGPPALQCLFPFVACGDACIYYEEECPICEPGGEPEPLPDGGVDIDERGAAADVALPGPGVPGIPVDPGGPGACRPPIDEYPVPEPVPVPRPR
jgi:hypothetical protein